MSKFLEDANRTWGLHGSGGCLAFVIDDRYVVDEEIDPDVELRLAVTCGENVFPEGRQRGVLEPDPTPGKLKYGLHVIGTRGKRMTVFDQWFNGYPADDGMTGESMERRAREILAEISDEDYARALRNGPKTDPLPEVRRSSPVEMVGWELVANEEQL